jgi:hypothetical protein
VKILSFGVTQQFDDVTNWILDLMIGVRLPPLEDDSYIDHVACSGYVELQVFVGFRGHQVWWGSKIFLQVIEGLFCLLSLLELVLFIKELKERESPNTEL